MDSSKSAVVLTAAVPSAATPAVIGRNFSPIPEILSPTFSIAAPASPIFTRAVWEFAASCCKSCRLCSVSIISLCRASYCSGETGFPNSSDTCFACCFREESSSDVSLISFCSWSYFSCEISPFASCSSAFLLCSFSSFSLVLVSSIFCLIGSYFVFQSS